MERQQSEPFSPWLSAPGSDPSHAAFLLWLELGWTAPTVDPLPAGQLPTLLDSAHTSSASCWTAPTVALLCDTVIKSQHFGVTFRSQTLGPSRMCRHTFLQTHCFPAPETLLFPKRNYMRSSRRALSARQVLPSSPVSSFRSFSTQWPE